MQKLEQTLDEWLVKKAPYQLPESVRQSLVKAMPYLTLLGGVLMLLAAWGLYQAVAFVSNLEVWANSLSVAYGLGSSAPVGMSFMAWIALGLLVVEAVLFFIAYPALLARQKKGWNILFWVTLLNAAQSVLQVVGGYTNLGSLLLSLAGSVVGLYLLFQIRGLYTGAAKAPSAATAAPATPAASSAPADKKE